MKSHKTIVKVVDEVRAAAAKHGWTYEQREPNVWRMERGDTCIDLAYTYGGGFNIQTVHVMQGKHDYWMTFKDRHKRLRLLDLLEERPRDR